MAKMSDRILPMPIMTLDEIWNFKYKIEISKTLFWNNTPCHLWVGGYSTNTNGKRGYVYIQGKLYRASRISYWLNYEMDPKEFLVCHYCNRMLCVNKEHLYLGTNQSNKLDIVALGRKSHV